MADWTPEEIQRIWEKGTECPPYDPNVWRKDQCGAWMCRCKHGAVSANESHTSFKWQFQMLDHFNGIIMIVDRITA